MLIGHITALLEQFAPPALQEDYDNSGLQIGSLTDECTGVLLCVDATVDVVNEAVDKGCNLIVSHHPLIFKGLKRLTGANHVQRAVVAAIKNGIALYACHTNLDNAPQGVSHRMAKMMGLDNIKPLDVNTSAMLKLVTFVPVGDLPIVRDALFDAGAGHIGQYDLCSYSSDGQGTFRALDGADPYVGKIGEMHTEPEARLEVILPAWLQSNVEKTLLQVHPYQTPAYEFISVNAPAYFGCGAVGNLDQTLTASELVEKVKTTFCASVARCSRYDMTAPMRRIALCGGAGSFLADKAMQNGATALITADARYHEFADLANEILLIDIGHHETENCSKQIFYDILSEKFPNFAIRYSEADINPINYI